MAAAWALIFLLVPAAVLALVQHATWARRLGAIVVCYAAGLLVGNSGLLPDAALVAQRAVSEIAVVLALPLLLFTLDVRAWRHAAGRAMLSMAFATIAVVAMALLLFFAFRAQGVPRPHEYAGLTVGVYTGGTPNLAAIKAGLQVPDARYVLFHTFEMLIGGAYLLFMMTAARPLARRWLGQPPAAREAGPSSAQADAEAWNEDYRALLRPATWGGLLRGLVASAAIVAVAVGAGQLVHEHARTPTIIFLVTTLALAASLWRPVRTLPHAYKLGMYLIYAFSFAVASMARFSELLQGDLSPLLFLSAAVVGSLAIHAALCRLARIDADTFLLTSVGAICSPPFVPMVARTLDNPSAMLSGISAGIVGYAIGNYLGITLGLLLARLP